MSGTIAKVTSGGADLAASVPLEYDPLTGLFSRATLHAHLSMLQARGEHPALLALDLDRFQAVNDSTGIATGDGVLVRVAKRIASAAPPDAVIARISGDEFAVIIPNATHGERVAAHLLDLISRPFAVNGFAVTLSVSIGLAIAPEHGEDPDALLRAANIALHRAEQEGKNRWCRFEPWMQEQAAGRQVLETDLRAALAMNRIELRRTMGVQQFEVYYQPQVAISTRAVTGFEALVRWRHPTRGMVASGEFIPLAEEIGLIGLLGDWVLGTACRAAMTWPESADGAVTVAVNVSPLQLREGRSMIGSIANALATSGLPAHRLEIEITESALNTDALETLMGIKALGVRLALDDFGTGYSSLSQLAQYPFDRLKIDRSFIRALVPSAHATDDAPTPEDLHARWMIQAIASLGSGLGLTTVAEGVETEFQAEIVRFSGVTDVQGYLFDKPMPEDAVCQWIREHAAYAHTFSPKMENH
ncbi:MAG: EAL domain-containing protein [Gemmatimonadaceae bacterium]|nr:EAL domain-containing protein [Gemmatimonadaceae bacterium]